VHHPSRPRPMRNFQQMGARQRGAVQQSCHVPSGQVQAPVRIPNNQGYTLPFPPPSGISDLQIFFLILICVSFSIFFHFFLGPNSCATPGSTSSTPPTHCLSPLHSAKSAKGTGVGGGILTVGQNSACGTPHRGEFWATRKRREKNNILRQFNGRGYSVA